MQNPEQPVDELTKVRQVLTNIVNTSQFTITEETDLAQLGNSTNQEKIRALQVIARKIIDETPKSYSSKDFRTAKDSYGQRVTLILADYGPSTQYIQLSYGNYQPNDITFRMPLAEDYLEVKQLIASEERKQLGFFDKRTGRNTLVDWNYEEDPEFNLFKFRLLWRGLRWLSVNLLNWNDRFYLPEDLDPEELPPGSTPLMLE